MSDQNTEWPDTLTAYEHERLEPLVVRLLSGNPSPFTFTGTQTYIVGRPDGSDVAIVDPGPEGDEQVEAILSVVGDRNITAIMCTHTHRDHSPAAAPLAERTGAPIVGCAPLTLDDDGPRMDAAFDPTYAPDRVLADGERVKGDGWTLEAVETPGHTSNHLCFSLLESGALFTGDHVMKWSTSVVSPPDGDMAAYMASLSKLYEREDRIYYPAHGPAADKPRQLVRGMIGHRKQRENQILRVLEGGPDTIESMVPKMYKGTDPRLYPAAGRSVLAHLNDLEGRGIVRLDADSWSLA